MANTPSDILKEYLVAIGFKIDDPGFKKTQEKVGLLDKGILRYRDDLVLAGITLSATVKTMAYDLEQLYFASQRTGSSAFALTAWSLAAQNAGVSAETARAAAENLAAAVRTQPGLGFLLRNLGVDTAKGSVEQLNQLVEKLSTFEKLGPAGHAIAARYASMFGMDEQTLFMLEKNLPELKKTQQAQQEWLKSVGLSDAGLKDITKSGHEFMDKLRELKSHMQILAMIMASRFLPVGEKIVGWISSFVDWAIKADKATDGWSSRILAVVTALGGLRAAASILGLVGRALGLGSAAEAVGGGALAGAAAPLAATAVIAGSGYVLTNKKARDKWNNMAMPYTDKILNSFLPQNIQAAIGQGIIDFQNPLGTLKDSFTDIKNFIGSKEGFKNKAYWDVNHWSIGYGTPAKSKDETIDEAEASKRRDAVIDSTRDFVKSKVHIPIPEGLLDALTSLAYNIGTGSFAAAKHLLGDVNSGNFTGAANDLLDFDKVRKNGILVRDPGLHARREQERAMALGGATINQENHITIHGVSDPHEAGKQVGEAIRHQNSEFLRNANNMGAIPV